MRLVFLAAIAALLMVGIPITPSCEAGWGMPDAVGQPPQTPGYDYSCDESGCRRSAHPATCRISVAVSGHSGQRYMGSGTLIDVDAGKGLVVTAAHVVRGSTGDVTCKFPNGTNRTGKVATDKDRFDVAAILIDDPGIKPVKVATQPAQVGQEAYSAGYGGEGKYLVNSGRVQVSTGDRMVISGRARGGDSGGPVFDRRGLLVGVLWGTTNNQVFITAGPRTHTFLRRAGTYLLPYRERQDRRVDDLEGRIDRLPAPVPPRPPGNYEPQDDLRFGMFQAEISTLKGQVADLQVVADKAKQLAVEWPALADELEAINAKADEAKGTAETAATTATTAKTTAETAVETVTEATDEENPKGIVGKLKARIEAAKVEGAEGVREVAKTVAMGVLKAYGMPAGVVLLVLGFVVWDIRKKVKEGDPLLVEKVVTRVRERTGSVRQRLHNRFNPDEEEEEEEGDEPHYVRQGSKFVRV